MKRVSFMLSVLLLAASAQAQKQNGKVPPPPPPVLAEKKEVPPPPPSKEPTAALQVFLRRNPTIRNISWSNGPNTIQVHLKSGTTETYHLDNAKEAKAFEEKYGEAPMAPPPPPPRVAS
jgi:hypothetical protein